MHLTSLEELELLMLVAGSAEPVQTALQMRQRWSYILEVAKAASRGEVRDRSLPEVIHSCDQYVQRAQRLIAALDEWLEARRGGTLSDPGLTGPDRS